MARPAYIVFSQSAAVDQATNSISFFNVIEGIEGRAAGPETPFQGDRGLAARLAAVWMKEEGDTPDILFEGEIICTSPGGVPIFMAVFAPFSFASTISFHRITVNDVRLPGFPELGVYVIEARLRRAGQEEWIARQTFPFSVSEAAPQPAAADKAPPIV